MAEPQVIQLIAGEAGAPIVREAVAATGFTSKPGAFIKLDSSGEVIAGGADSPIKWLALADPTSARDIETAYAAGDLVRYGKFHAGQEVNALLADAESVTPASLLATDASGHLVVVTDETNAVAVANETLTASGVSRVKATIL